MGDSSNTKEIKQLILKCEYCESFFHTWPALRQHLKIHKAQENKEYLLVLREKRRKKRKKRNDCYKQMKKRILEIESGRVSDEGLV